MVLRPRRRGRPDGATEEWRAIAQGPDILYEICAWPDKRGRWTEDEFYAVGRADWADFRRHWEHYGMVLGGTCVEIGCGPGRVTAALAEDFGRVVAVDVSADLLEMARRRVPPNVELHQVDGPALPLAPDEADAVFSVHVFQHLETPDVVDAYLSEVRRVLRAGGTAMLHIQTSSDRPRRASAVKNAVALWRSRASLRRGATHTYVRMRHYRHEEVFAMLRGAGFGDIELRVFPVRSNGFHHSFWLARC